MRKAARAGKSREELQDLARAAAEAAPPPEPTWRRHTTSDPTVEKLGELLRDNDSIGIVRDELTGFIRGLEKPDRQTDRAVLPGGVERQRPAVLLRSDRPGDDRHPPSVRVDHRRHAARPPDEAGPVGARGEEADDGLLSRFQLLVWPDPAGEWRNVDRWPDSDAKNRAHAVYKALEVLDPILIGASPDEDGGPPYLRFSPEAQDVFDGWRERLEATIRTPDLNPLVESHLAKYRSLMPSLALLFHLVDVVDGAPSGPVSAEAARLAAAWCDFLEEHARRVYDCVTTPDLEAPRPWPRSSRPAPCPARSPSATCTAGAGRTWTTGTRSSAPWPCWRTTAGSGPSRPGRPAVRRGWTSTSTPNCPARPPGSRARRPPDRGWSRPFCQFCQGPGSRHRDDLAPARFGTVPTLRRHKPMRPNLDLRSVCDGIDLAAAATRLLGPAPGRRGERSDRLWWVCPFHPDRNPSLCVRPGGRRWRCFGCGATGDAVELARRLNPGLTFPEAVRFLNGAATPARPRQAPRLRPGPVAPPDGWGEWAATLVADAERRLWTSEGEEARSYLHGRGLTDATIRAARLGLVTADRPGVPSGLVIPWFDGPTPRLVNVRRPEGARPKYQAIRGSRRGGLYPGPEAVRPGRPLIIVEGELDRWLLAQELGELAGVVTLGSASARPTPDVLARLLAAAPWCVATDADPAGDGAAGPWLAFPRGRRVRPPGDVQGLDRGPCGPAGPAPVVG